MQKKKCDDETDSFAKGATFEQLIYRIKMNKQTDDVSNAQVMGWEDDHEVKISNMGSCDYHRGR